MSKMEDQQGSLSQFGVLPKVSFMTVSLNATPSKLPGHFQPAAIFLPTQTPRNVHMEPGISGKQIHLPTVWRIWGEACFLS